MRSALGEAADLSGGHETIPQEHVSPNIPLPYLSFWASVRFRGACMATSLRRRREPERARAATLTAPPEQAPSDSPRLVVAVVAVVVLGVVLRFLTMSHLWLDEALTVNIARLPLSRISDALRHDGSPPLYYLAMHVWTSVFGSGDVAVRALSATFSLATL